MLSIHLTLAQVVNYLSLIAARDPERVGKSDTGGCIYATNDGGVLTPICIVGQMFADLGLLRLLMLDPSDLAWSKPNSQACGVTSSFWNMLDPFGITADDDAKRFAHSVQRRQDDGVTWAGAFAAAVQEYRDMQQSALDSRLSDLFG